MKWFFAFNQLSEQNYGDFVRVAVVSARQNTDLEAFCLYDGAPSELTRWLETQGVTVLPCRFRFADWWEEQARAQNNPLVSQIALGAFLRFELPDVMQRENMEDSFALYTDCDVMFEGGVQPLLEPLEPRFFAVAPETFRHQRLHMNSGAMWMNVPRLRQENARFMRFAHHHMMQTLGSSFDQGIYRAYFDPFHRFAWKVRLPDRFFYAVMSRLPLKTWRWDDLPLELNWKPYWGENPAAAIIHFHGLKPTQRAALKNGELPPHIAQMHTPFWEKCVAKWDNWLQIARQT
ncbi:MAG: hypothetical protein KY445_09610 [Armatimonadetes bacterium]|nr:hypothetical protein [Armatimonadota bacterium]